MGKVCVLLVDDHPLFRQALRASIEAEADLQVVGEASDGKQAVQLALQLDPDVIVMDLHLPVKDGIAAIGEIVARKPRARILAITSSTEDSQVVAAVRAGATGYLLKEASRAEFLEGLRQVARGNTFLPAEVAEMLAHGVRQGALAAPGSEARTPLTRREQEVLTLLGRGLTNRAIASQLRLSESTVRVHVYHLLTKLGLQDRGQAIVYALRTAAGE